jgi:hypothetical protein
VAVPESLLPLLTPPPGGLFAYVGLGPGQEFLPYFLALLAWVGASLIAVFKWPFVSLLRRLRGSRSTGEVGPQEVPAPASLSNPPEEGEHVQQ